DLPISLVELPMCLWAINDWTFVRTRSPMKNPHYEKRSVDRNGKDSTRKSNTVILDLIFQEYKISHDFGRFQHKHHWGRERWFDQIYGLRGAGDYGANRQI